MVLGESAVLMFGLIVLDLRLGYHPVVNPEISHLSSDRVDLLLLLVLLDFHLLENLVVLKW